MAQLLWDGYTSFARQVDGSVCRLLGKHVRVWSGSSEYKGGSALLVNLQKTLWYMPV